MGRIAVTGSVAYDTIMAFGGRFGDHILPDRADQLNVSFLVDAIERRRGGTAANVSYTLALLGERPLLCGAVGAADFTEYAEALERVGVDTTAALWCDDVGTGAAYITTDLDDNQITAFYAGAMARAGAIDITALHDVSHVVVGANASAAMARHVRDSATMRARLVFVPAQQIPSMSDEELREGVDTAWIVAGNEYEIEMIRQRTGFEPERVSGDALVAVTHGARGSVLHTRDGGVEIPVANAAQVVDPTGAGDAYVAGLLSALRSGAAPAVAGRVAATVASFVVEQPGPQAHHVTRDELRARYAASFGDDLPDAALPPVTARA